MPILCEIVTQERLVFSEEVDSVNVPGVEGRMGILPNHAPLLTTLSVGELVVSQDGVEQVFAIGGGVLDVGPTKVTVLADVAEHSEEIDQARAEKAKEEAERLLAEGVDKTTNPDEYMRLMESIQRANLRLNTVRKRGGSGNRFQN